MDSEKGHIKHFYHNNNFYYFLNQENVQLKNFKEYVLQVTDRIKSHVKEIISQTGCYSEYLKTTNISKEKIAQRILSENPEKEGLLCVLSSVEPCYTLTVKYNARTKKLEKKHEYRKWLLLVYRAMRIRQ